MVAGDQGLESTEEQLRETRCRRADILGVPAVWFDARFECVKPGREFPEHEWGPTALAPVEKRTRLEWDVVVADRFARRCGVTRAGL